MTLRARLTIHTETETSDVIGFVTPSAVARLVSDYILTEGVDTGQANALFNERITLSPLETRVVDLSGLINDLGQSLTFTSVKWIIFKADKANLSVITLKPAASRGWLAPFNAVSDTVRIAAKGGVLVMANPTESGWPVVFSSTDRLLLTNPSVSFAGIVDMMIVGVGDLS